MKPHKTFLFLFLFLFIGIGTTTAYTNVSIDDYTMENGTYLEVPVWVNTTDYDLTGASINTTFDSSVIHVVGMTAGDWSSLTYNINNESGFVSANNDNMDGETGDITLWYMNISAIGGSGTSTDLNMDLRELLDYDLNDISNEANVSNGSITIESATGFYITNTTPSSPHTSEEGDCVEFYAQTSNTGAYTWLLNGTNVASNTSVGSATYTNCTASTGTYNLTVQAENATGSDSYTWIWNVEPKNYIPSMVVNNLDSELFPTSVSQINLSINDSNGLSDVSEVRCDIWRSNGSYTDSDNAFYHYEFSAEPGGAYTSSPGNQFIQDDPLSDSGTEDYLIMNFTPEHYALPSKGTNNPTVNGYNWNMTCEVTDSEGNSTYTTSTTEMNRLISYDKSASSISADCDNFPCQYSPNINIVNQGNVKLNITFLMSNQTSPQSSENITPSMCYIDDDPTYSGSRAYDYEDQYLSTNIFMTDSQTIYNWFNPPDPTSLCPADTTCQFSGTYTLGGVESEAI